MFVIEGVCIIFACYTALTENYFLISLKVKVLKNKFLQDFKALPSFKHGVIEKKGENFKCLIYIPLCSIKNWRSLKRLHGNIYSK